MRTSCWLWVFFLLISPATADSGRILATPAQIFRGWGMSLAWEANDLYGGGRQPAQIKDPNLQAQYMDLLYGDPATRLTLGFTVARYNIGGGDDPTHAHMRPDAQMEGFQSGPGAPFDWTRDAAQRRMLQEAKKRGADLFEAFSVSPPYWMTVSGCSSGNKPGQREDNLRPDMYVSFVNYLATVVKHFRDVEGVRFESLEPFNEPDLGWGAGGRQEGYSAAPSVRNILIPMLARRLKQDDIDTFVSGMDTNNVAAAVGSVEQLDPNALGALGRLNTHDYHAAVYWVRLNRLTEIAQKLHKPIWMSELGCCFPHQGDGTDMWGALFMADSVRMDLRDLGAEAWVMWQPDWNVIAFDPDGGSPHLKKQYYALAQYTRFIRPGFQIISSGGAYHTLAAYSSVSRRLVLVTTNWDAVTANDLDLTAFAKLPSSVAVYRTTDDETVNLRQGTIAISAKGHIVDSLPPRSVSTYVIDGVLPSSIPSSASIEGTRQIVSQATRLCFNINRNTSNSGEAIIPYPCGGFTNMEFNFVDQGGGFYSIHTVNGMQDLCLNISSAASSPGDGKRYGGPGNLIQWGCGNGSSPPSNELFKLLDLGGGGRQQIRVKNSGLCLEDPGRGGTIRQNVCSSSPNQIFTLTQ
jgi:O-glycosyl hydrolase